MIKAVLILAASLAVVKTSEVYVTFGEKKQARVPLKIDFATSFIIISSDDMKCHSSYCQISSNMNFYDDYKGTQYMYQQVRVKLMVRSLDGSSSEVLDIPARYSDTKYSVLGMREDSEWMIWIGNSKLLLRTNEQDLSLYVDKKDSHEDVIELGFSQKNMFLETNFDFTMKRENITQSSQNSARVCFNSDENLEQKFILGGTEVFIEGWMTHLITTWFSGLDSNSTFAMRFLDPKTKSKDFSFDFELFTAYDGQPIKLFTLASDCDLFFGEFFYHLSNAQFIIQQVNTDPKVSIAIKQVSPIRDFDLLAFTIYATLFLSLILIGSLYILKDPKRGAGAREGYFSQQ